ncbi:MAG: PD40 domain-containing protein, partial [Acidobacteriaceae bacterium]|nr:PD40 domain-containing protein [Acidobacteriaceae bacterium]
QQLTTNSTDNPVWQAAISPDGKYLAYGDSDGIKIRVIATGETHLLPKPAELSDREIWLPAAWFPDGTRLLASSIGKRMSAWSVSVIGGKATLLRDDAGVDSVSPDGSLIAFTTGNTYRAQPPDNNATSLLNTEIWVMGPNGENARKIVSAQKGTYFASVRWSPTGERLAYRKLRLAHEDSEYSIETCDPNGGTPTVVLSSRRLRWYSAGSDLGSGDLAWTPDGRLNYALNEAAPNLTDRNLWATPVNPKTGKVRGNPQRVTNLTGLSMNGLSVTTDGKRMVFDSESDGSQIYIRSTVPNADLRSAKLLTHDKRYNEPFTWTADSKAVIFASNRAGAFGIYKQALDQSEAEFIPTGEGENILVRRSPDGKWIISTRARGQGQSREFIRIPVIGGAPQPLFKTNGGYDNFSCPYRADARCIVSECVDYKRCVFESFDVVTRSRSKLFDMPMPEQREFHWTVSPDGSHLAMIGPDPQGRIEIRSLRGEIERTIEAKGWPNPLQIDWTADSKSVIVRCLGLIDSPSGPLGGTLLRVDFDGNVEPLWETRGGRTTWAIPSPDGKYLAIRDPVSDRNVWMIENF